ncbi:PilW family protein [Lysobacter enzymogenes]|uniref:PilW family protein n=1 Tax=Lysobacter enzymogenes TaxID=69 RepID=UPI0008969F5D|nr:PilW family protein [Lysobacter enzymogenes]SDY06152.1 type IV pilus assembly protein PilW [Lysobacter enzymogenes]
MSPAAGAQRGLSMIELMVALVLGLLLTMGALSIFLASRSAYRTTEDLSRVQEAARIAFELMARDVREAGGNQCAESVRTGNVVSERDDAYWQNWKHSLRGVGATADFVAPALGFGTAAGTRVSGTDGLELHSSEDLGIYLTQAMTAKDSALTVNAIPADVRANDVLVVCDFRLVSYFRATAVSGGAIEHGTGGNCSAGFTRFTDLTCNDDKIPLEAWHLYGANAVVGRPRAVRWFVGNNARNGKSLYRAVLYSGGAAPAADEVAEGISQMQIQYLSDGDNAYRAASEVADWSKVKAARAVLTLESERKSGTGGEAIGRTVTATLSLRNRNS